MIKRIAILLLLSISFLVNANPILADDKGAFDICKPGMDSCIADYFCQPSKADPSTFLCQPPRGAFEICDIRADICMPGYSCQTSKADPTTHLCQPPLGALEICIDADSKCIDGYTCQPSNADPNTLLCQKDTVGSVFGKIKPPPAIAGLLKGDPTGAGGISKFLSNLVILIYAISTVVLIFMILWGAIDWMISEGDKEKLANAQKKLINAFIGIILLAAAFAIIKVLGQFTGFTFFEGQNITTLKDNSSFKYRCPDGTWIGGDIKNPEEYCKKYGYQ